MKWNAVALWAWDIVVDNCAICRNHIMDLCEYSRQLSGHLERFADILKASSVRQTKPRPPAKSVQLPGVFAMWVMSLLTPYITLTICDFSMRFIFTAFLAG